MAHLQYMPGDPRLVDQLVYELKSKGIFDQFRKDCIADVDTRPAYQNLRQRVENSVSTFLSRQTWQPDLNKNQLREKLRKHILDGNYLEQGVERIVDQVVNPKVASVFIPKVEDLVYNYLGITKKKSPAAETSSEKIEDLLPNDLEAVSPGSVKSNEDKNEPMEIDGQEENKMELDEDKPKSFTMDNIISAEELDEKTSEIQLPSDIINDDKCEIPLPSDEIETENIPEPKKMEIEKIELPKEPIVSTDIPLPDDAPKEERNDFFKPINSDDDDDSSSDSSLRRNMSPLTPIRNYNNENSCDAQQAFENELVDEKNEDKNELNSFRFAIDAKSPESTSDAVKPEKKESDNNLAYQFNNQVNIDTPLYEDSSNSNILHIDYESDANSKVNLENKGLENDQSSKDSRKEHKTGERKSSHKSSHRSRDSRKHSSSKDKRSDSKHNSRDSSRHDKSKLTKDDNKPKSNDKERSRDRSDKKDSRDSSRHRSSHKSSHKDSKSHRSSSSSQKHSSKNDDRKSSSSQKDKEKSSDKTDKSKDSKSSSHKSDKDRKTSTSSKSDKSKSKHDDKDKDKKSKKEKDDHYSVSGRGNPNRRSTDRDSNDGSSSSKGSNNQSSSKSTNGKKGSKSSTKSETTSTSGESTSPSDKENVVQHGTSAKDLLQHKPIVRIDSHLETPVASPPRLPFVPDVTIKKPKYAANLEEAKRLMKMRKFLDEEQKRMNQEAALLLEFQANVRPSLSQVYSSIPGPELEFACITNSRHSRDIIQNNDNIEKPHYTNNQLLTVLNDECEEEKSDTESRATTSTEPIAIEANEHDPELPQNIIDNKYNHDNNNYNIDKRTEYQDIKDKDKVAKECKTFIETKFEEKVNKNSVSYVDLKDEITNNNHHGNKIKTEAYINGEIKLKYFDKHEKYDAEIEKVKFTSFFKEYNKKSTNNIYLINCDSYEENIIREVSKNFGNFEIINYIKNGHLKLPTTNVIKHVNITTEVSLPIEMDYEMNDPESPKSQMFSPGKSECSFELSSDYDAKLTEMVNKTSRQEIMEIILGNALASSPNKMPRIDYFTDSNIDAFENNMKRKISEETTVNNNRHVLTPNKIRRLSTEQISSTTQEIEEPANKISNCTRSKYLGKARRVGLSRPRKPLLSNSPSSDKSVENYEQNTPTQSPNGKIKRSKVQRYDTSDLYKPKLHYLSRRNHIT